MQVTRLLTIVTLMCVLLQGSTVTAYSQNISWMKGLWNEYSGTPYWVPPSPCTNTLLITAVKDSTFTGMQNTFFAADSTISIAYPCSGLLTQNKAPQFHRGNVLHKQNSNKKGYEWKDCTGCDARTCSLYIENAQIKLLIETKDCDNLCNGIIVYYRDLNDFDSATQQYLVSQYKEPPKYTTVLTNYSSANSNPRHSSFSLQQQQEALSVDSSTGNKALPLVLINRKNKLAQKVQISSPQITVILLDDMEIDGDIVSLYHNNVEVLSHKMLGKEVIKYSFTADKQHTYHELVLVAQNLGSIPPNTALMRIRAGDKKYELTTRANMQENANVVIEYTGE